MSGLDVLAWLDSLHVTDADGAITNRKWPEAQEAHSAVTELIEAARFARTTGNGPTGYTLGADRRLAAAIVRCFGGTP